ncbi:Tetratricopeptide repeat protein 28 [Rhynchospora pubera]|uniref:Tetratricopeptide repeat protein 28 n=1 Tax=Rhynchospora pubera TaxID=906938 RepID=A0AAV8FC31_9POAL|nr:Tetratricopeptide repeat protein 28 [Rhynchospora pubera]
MASSLFSDKKKKAKELVDAASSGNLRLLKEIASELNEGNALIAHTFIKEIKDSDGDSVFHVAAAHGRTAICQYLLDDLGFPVDFVSQRGDTPLLCAAMGGHPATTRYLISRGANPIVSDKAGLTPLHCAAMNGQPGLVKFLLSLGVPVDVKFNHATGTPLNIAALRGQASTMEVLLDHHANVNAATSNEYTPLFSSICFGPLECTKLLIKAGADVNLRCPLELAIIRESIEIIKWLLKAGADPNIRNEYGWLPLEIAVMGSKWDIAEMLFPLTSPVPEVHDWSVQGILQYVKSNAFTEKNEEFLERNLADLKVKGADSFRKKEYLAANIFYSKAMKIASARGSDDAVLFSNRSLCWLRMGEGDRAREDALMAKRLSPEWPKAYYRIGAALMLLEDYEQASRAFEDGLRLDPTNIEMKKAHREAVDCLKRTHFGETSK